jgi:serine acetyltransferase
VIGRGSVIGGNTFVTESIPADSVVMQGQGKLEVKSRRRT